MAKAYSDDLRRKVLEAHAAGEGILEELAERFSVSVGWVFKISAALGKTGKMERQPGAKRGRVSKVTPEIETFIQEAIQCRSDITLAELQLKLFEEQNLEISIGRLWQVVDKLGLRFKKKSARGRTRHSPRPRTPSQLAGGGR
jgi:transposase